MPGVVSKMLSCAALLVVAAVLGFVGVYLRKADFPAIIFFSL
jgi:hypothetical protein